MITICGGIVYKNCTASTRSDYPKAGSLFGWHEHIEGTTDRELIFSIGIANGPHFCGRIIEKIKIVADRNLIRFQIGSDNNYDLRIAIDLRVIDLRIDTVPVFETYFVSEAGTVIAL